MSKTIVLTGGGTAGHVSPNLALLPYLLKEGYTVHYIGSKNGIETQMLKGENVFYHAVSTGKLRRYFDWQNFSDPFRVINGAMQSLKILKEIKPDVVFSKGGFVSVPVVWAAHKLNIPVLLHESDISPGLANRICTKYAKYVCTTFPECADLLHGKGKITGTPLRSELFKGSRQEGLNIAGFLGNKPVLLVMGGSQGSVAVNKALRESLDDITAIFDVFHICGRGNIDKSIQNPAYYQTEFMDEKLPSAFACADVVLSRAGSNSLSEFHALAKPMLLIPLPLGASRGDQIQNARSYERRGLALTLMQEDMNKESLTAKLKELLNKKDALAAALKNSPLKDGTQNVLKLIEEIQQK